MREKITFLGGEETVETAAATKRVVRTTVVNSQMDVRTKFAPSPAVGTTADVGKDQGKLSLKVNVTMNQSRDGQSEQHSSCHSHVIIVVVASFRCQ